MIPDTLIKDRYRVRAFERSEIEHITNLSEVLIGESVLSVLGFNRYKAESWLLSVHTHKNSYFQRAIVDDSDIVVGIFVAQIIHSVYSDSPLINDCVIFVDKSHRGKCVRRLKEIADALRVWAKHHKAKLIMIGSSTGIDPDSTERVFEYLGFKRVGTVHAYNVGE